MLTLKNILNLGYSAIEVANRVFLVESFLTPKECEELRAIGETSTQEAWEGVYTRNLENFCKLKFGRTDVENLVAEGKFEITKNWSDKSLEISNLPISWALDARIKKIFEGVIEINEYCLVGTMQRQYEGVPLAEHVDNHTDPSLVYAAVVYINDDYEGGEVYFSRFGLSFKPKAGSLLIFPTSDEWSHGVAEVKAGPCRYVLPIFIGQKNFYSVNRY
jgi:hypothetical protein